MKKKYMYKPPNFFQRNFSFSGKMTAGEFWSEFGMRLIGMLCAMIILCIVLVIAVPAEPEELAVIMDVIVSIMSLICFISITALTRRRLRDAGYGAKSYLWLLVPGIGLIAFIARLCSRSVE